MDAITLGNCKNVNLVVSTVWRHTEGSRCVAHSFLTRALDGGKWSTSRPGRFAPVKRALNNNQTGILYSNNVRPRTNQPASFIRYRDEQSAGGRRCIPAEHESLHERLTYTWSLVTNLLVFGLDSFPILAHMYFYSHYVVLINEGVKLQWLCRWRSSWLTP